jgi:prepilin-type N-terminal cleavage/methylation domain-containing protein
MKMLQSGFTLVEVIISIVILAVLTAFALPVYTRSLEEQRERAALVQLQALHTANQLHFAQVRPQRFVPGERTVDEINALLRISILPGNDMNFFYNGINDQTYTAQFRWSMGGGVFKQIMVDENPLGPTNPCCFFGGCFRIADC